MHGRANLMGHMGNFLGGGYEKTMKSNGMKNMLELLPSLIVIFFSLSLFVSEKDMRNDLMNIWLRNQLLPLRICVQKMAY